MENASENHVKRTLVTRSQYKSLIIKPKRPNLSKKIISSCRNFWCLSACKKIQLHHPFLSSDTANILYTCYLEYFIHSSSMIVSTCSINFDVYLHKKSTHPSLLSCDIVILQTCCCGYFGHDCQCRTRFIISTSLKLCFSACRNPILFLPSFLRYCNIANLFWVTWACLVMPTKNEYELLHFWCFSASKISTWSLIFFLRYYT